jgi:hypothetical protein
LRRDVKSPAPIAQKITRGLRIPATTGPNARGTLFRKHHRSTAGAIDSTTNDKGADMYAHEFALLAAVAIPFLAIVGINVYLWWEGERGTLLMPSSEKLHTLIEAGEQIEEQPLGYETAPARIVAQPVSEVTAPANDARVREAA